MFYYDRASRDIVSWVSARQLQCIVLGCALPSDKVLRRRIVVDIILSPLDTATELPGQNARPVIVIVSVKVYQ